MGSSSFEIGKSRFMPFVRSFYSPLHGGLGLFWHTAPYLLESSLLPGSRLCDLVHDPFHVLALLLPRIGSV